MTTKSRIIYDVIDCSTDIELQVWRLSINNYTRRLYNKVGANRFTLTLNRTAQRIVQWQLAPHHQIEVAPGDVLGFQMFNPEDSNKNQNRCRKNNDINLGIVHTLNYINGTKANEEVWYAYVSNRVVDNRLSVDVGPNGTLNRFRDTAPIISASVITSMHSVTVIASPTLTGKITRDDEGKEGTR